MQCDKAPRDEDVDLEGQVREHPDPSSIHLPKVTPLLVSGRSRDLPFFSGLCSFSVLHPSYFKAKEEICLPLSLPNVDLA